MYVKKVSLYNHDSLPILMLLHTMLYIMFVYLMLFYLMLFVCTIHFLLLIFANAFCFMLCLGLLTQFVYFMNVFPSCAVLMICWFFLILCSHHFLYDSALWSNST